MRSCRSSAAKIRWTAACIFGSKKGSLNDFKRGCRKLSTSSALAKPLRISSRAMHSEPQISLHEIGPFRSSSADAMIHRLCTDQFIRAELSDKMQQIPCVCLGIALDSTNGDFQCKKNRHDDSNTGLGYGRRGGYRWLCKRQTRRCNRSIWRCSERLRPTDGTWQLT